MLEVDGDAHARRNPQPEPADVEGHFQPGPQSLGCRHGALLGGRCGEHDAELVASEPGERVVRPQGCGEPEPHLAQHRVARGVPTSVSFSSLKSSRSTIRTAKGTPVAPAVWIASSSRIEKSRRLGSEVSSSLSASRRVWAKSRTSRNASPVRTIVATSVAVARKNASEPMPSTWS